MTPKSRQVSIYIAIVSVSLAIVLNPLVVGLFLTLNLLQTAYLGALDLGLATILLLCLLHLALRRRVLYVLAALCTIGLLPALVAAEFGLLYARATRPDDPTAKRWEGLVRPDPRLGWSLIPNAVTRSVSPGNYGVVYRLDERGRKAIPQAEGAERTLHFFGDSFTFGIGATNEDSALNRLAERLYPRVNVQNYGVTAYGLDQMFLRLKDNIDEVGPSDVVVFSPTSWNLQRNLLFKSVICRTVFAEQGGKSRLPKWRGGKWEFVTPREGCGFFEALLTTYPELPIGWLYYWYRGVTLAEAIIERSDRLLAETARLARERGARFLLVFLVSPDQCRTREFHIDLEPLKTPFATLMPFCPKDPGEIAALRFPTDGHWTPKGNRWAARSLETVLTQKIPELRP